MQAQADKLLRLILILTAITMIVVWLPFIRGFMDGPTYAWGNTFFGLSFGGNGIGGQYWIVAVEALIAIAIVFLGWRGAKPPFHWLLLLWNVPSVFNSAYNAIKFPDDYRFKGDTLGVDVSLAWVGPAFWLVLAALSILWVVRDRKNPQRDWTPSWNRTNTILLSLVILLLPIQFFLLRFGTPTDDIRDPLGVILTMFQWLLLNLAFVPWQLPTTITETSRSTEQSPAGH